MQSKFLPFISSSLVALSVCVTEGYPKGLTGFDDESPRGFHYQIPERYSHLKELKNAALRDARIEAQNSSGTKRVGFRETIEIHVSDLLEELAGNPKENLQVSGSAVSTLTKLKLEKRQAVPQLKIIEGKPVFDEVKQNKKLITKKHENLTKHVRGAGNIINLEQLFARPLSPRAQERLNSLVANVTVERASKDNLKTWAKLGNIEAQRELGRRLMNRNQLITALKWVERAIEQGDKQSIVLESEILDKLQKRHASFSILHEHYREKKMKSEIANPCLPARVPLFPFAGEKIQKDQEWKQWYTQANLMLTDNPFNPEAKKLLLAVALIKPSFKDTYFRLYLTENAYGNKDAAISYLKKAASGSQGLAVAQYQMGINLLQKGQRAAAETWLKKASDQQYWLADKELMNLYSKNMQRIERTLNSHKRFVRSKV